MKVTIGSRKVGDNYPLFFIAEAGVNHNGDLELAKRLVDAAVDAKADAVKFQTFKAEELSTINAPKAGYHIETTGSDSEQSWFALLKSQELSYEMHQDLIDYCRKREIIFLSTPYSKESVDLLENFNVPAYKIASADLNNLPFLEYVASKGKPIIISTGMSNMDEIRLAKEVFLRKGLADYIFLQCTSNYPTMLGESNLGVINTLRKKLNCLVGYSDHTDGYINPIAATALGACVYEKHFTLDKNLPGPDHRMSLDPGELKQTISFVRKTEQAIGSSEKRVLVTEQDNKIKLRKSIVANVDIKKDQIIEEKMLGVKRPGSGIPPAGIENILGKKAKIDIPSDTVLSFEMINGH
jgi:N-acetylneuraminate synthase